MLAKLSEIFTDLTQIFRNASLCDHPHTQLACVFREAHNVLTLHFCHFYTLKRFITVNLYGYK